MSHSFTTDLIPAPDRQEAWLSNAKQICGDCNFQFPKRFPFHGSIERRKVADLEMTLFSSSAVSFNKFPSFSLNAESRAWIVITQLAGLRRYCQDGKAAVLKKGDVTLIDSGRPWSSDCPGDCARLYLRVPRSLMQSRVRLGELPVARRIPGESGLGTFLFHLSTSLYRQAEELTWEEGAAAIEAYLRILAACVGTPGRPAAGTNRGSEPASLILKYIDAHLTETTLRPAEIAAALNLSVRHVHRLFSVHGSTLAEWIRTQRLRHCRSDLADPRLRAKSITEIAFFWGFNDSAHFSRVFKQRFGVCPRVFRSRASQGLPAAVEMSGD
ncbi:MAG: helix-turn-helix domain-containing protein [Acidobacteriia bacterium]|nr:helix-turn-helix domain-containing protein [Terriglobia bacterium]